MQWAFSYDGEYIIDNEEENTSYDQDYSYDTEDYIDYYVGEDNEEVQAHGGIKNDIFTKFNEACENYLEHECDQLLAEGQYFFDYILTDDEAQEICDENNYEFDEEGNLV